MTVHRPEWERRSELRSWTKDMTLSLVRFIAPAKDAGNATLTKDEEVWTFTPKTNRVIKIPASMKAQSWMGSDFSYQDLSRDDEIIDQYTHRLLSSENKDGHTIYTVESVPLDDAPVVWGKEILEIRDDYLILEHSFFDQDMKLVKKLTTRAIGPLGGKLF
ncbi:MAG: outer membrane lipoprotein-sorting protein, partial [Bdellovibrionales bacterium]|nr:outer membrane lipoprotein-sorting protein [Bdellovibrionales bacterium]